ncbi:MAG: Glycogen synthase [Firmicutes bacterium ADurb.Bin419]|nr:MAG: Glycogen synthase [Firmicutes bacterium ADurb.Bin419]
MNVIQPINEIHKSVVAKKFNKTLPRLNVYIDCEKPTGGIASHINSIKKFSNVNYVDNPNHADIRHWHFGGNARSANVATCHGFYTDRFAYVHKDLVKFINNILHTTFKNTEHVISVSDWVHDGIKEKWGIDSTVIRNGIDYTEFQNNGYDDYIFVSAYDCIEKNPEDIFRIAELMPDKKFKVIVNNHDKFPVLKNVELFNYPQPHHVVKQIMSKSKLVICPSLQEAGPIIILEAFASGKAVVAYDTTGPNEIVSNGHDGILCKTHDIYGMVNACETVWNNPEQYGAAALESSKMFDWRYSAQLLNDIYTKASYPTVSIIMLAYKNQDVLRQAINSCPRWAEVIVGDADGTHKHLVPSWCKYVRIDNINPGANRNQCLKHATGKYIAILDGDDYRFPGTLETQLRYLETHSDVVATCGGCFRNHVDTILWNIDKEEELDVAKWKYQNLIPHSSLVVRKSVMDKVKNYDDKLNYCEDYDIGWRINKHGKVIRLPIIAYYWRYSPTGRSRDMNMEAEYLKRVRDKNG